MKWIVVPEWNAVQPLKGKFLVTLNEKSIQVTRRLCLILCSPGAQFDSIGNENCNQNDSLSLCVLNNSETVQIISTVESQPCLEKRP